MHSNRHDGNRGDTPRRERCCVPGAVIGMHTTVTYSARAMRPAVQPSEDWNHAFFPAGSGPAQVAKISWSVPIRAAALRSVKSRTATGTRLQGQCAQNVGPGQAHSKSAVGSGNKRSRKTVALINYPVR